MRRSRTQLEDERIAYKPESKSIEISIKESSQIKKNIVDPKNFGTQVINWQKPSVMDDKPPLLSHILNLENTYILREVKKSLSINDMEYELLSKITVYGNYIRVFTNETLGHYADWLNLPTYRLRKLNSLGRRQKIYLGQKIKLYFGHVSVEQFEQRRLQYHIQILNGFLNEKKFVHFIEYEVSRGESVWHLARNKYQVPIEMIHYLNIDTDINNLYPGDVLRIPIFKL